MNEISHFLKFLRRRLSFLVVIPLVAMIVCYFLIRRLPDTYISRGRIATGIVDKTSQLVSNKMQVQESEIVQSFDNLVQMMRMKKIMDRVSHRLLIHDLTVPKDSVFLPPSEKLENLSATTKQRIANMLRQREDSLPDPVPDKLSEARMKAVKDILESMEYDENSLLERLNIYRLATSDYLEVEFEAENPRLTAFVVNTHISNFKEMYTQRLLESSNRSLEFLDDLVLRKRDALNERMDALKNYKIRNNVLNLDEQARGLYAQILDFETRREVAKKDVVAYRAALKNIDQRFDPKDRRFVESALSDANQRITRTRNELQSANDQYIRSNFSPGAKAKVDSLQEILSQQIRIASDEPIYSPQSAKADLVSRKLELEIAMELAQSSIASIDAQVNRLDEKYSGMVPDEASIQQLEASIEIASKEYSDALQRYNDARLESYSPLTLTIVEWATLGERQPSKKIILLLVAGVAAFLLCLLAFSLTYFLDFSVRTTAQLADATGLPVLGRINRISDNGALRGFDELEASDESTLLFKDLVRSIRYEIDEEVANPKIVAVSSLHDHAGKTDLTYGLAWAYARINQRVLVVDGNFSQPTISSQAKAKAELGDFFTRQDSYLYPDSVDFLSTVGGDMSLLEIADERTLREKFAHLKEQYDVVLIETPALTTTNQAKEWMLFADRIVVVFRYGRAFMEDDKSKLEYLRSRNGQLSGWILTGTDNEIEPMGRVLKKI
ncbi:exopolysaccharide transport family protein [Persicitalea jodogahamensis]|uniref:Lipopolysaccharide biosynthesis protein n=1 Tax=Persicitalea jodogahamensis TaxID=402147 RepID=A0A8J3D2F5_9BACT|nr:cellulose synthase operon protein YhjQ/BcsQ [Persicitalea jodogahamensis]GHB61416.1 hypothetical protein GCM10007390_14050 [Persicitalea jodogahamensis]